MKYKFNMMTGQVTRNGQQMNNDILSLVTEMNKIELKKKELARKYTEMQEKYAKLNNENKMLKNRKNYRDIIDNILVEHTNNTWVYESHIIDYHYWTTSKEISFQPQFFTELEKENLYISDINIEDDEIHIYIRQL